MSKLDQGRQAPEDTMLKWILDTAQLDSTGRWETRAVATLVPSEPPTQSPEEGNQTGSFVSSIPPLPTPPLEVGKKVSEGIQAGVGVGQDTCFGVTCVWGVGLVPVTPVQEVHL